MKISKLYSTSVVGLFAACLALAPVAARAQAESPDAVSAKAQTAFDTGNYKEAADAYQELLTKYPTWMGAAGAQLQLGYVFYLLGDYDKALLNLKKVLITGGTATPEQREVATSLIPQALAAKAAKETKEDKRKAGYEAAIAEFDSFLKQFPTGEEVEHAIYGKALAFYQIAKYEDAVAALRGSVEKFAQSASVLDTQFMLGLTLATQGNLALQADSNSAAGIAKFEEAEKILRQIIARNMDVALANEAQFQIGELLFNRGSLGPEAERNAIWNKAIEAYRAVKAKDLMVKAQETRIKAIQDARKAAGQARNLALVKRAERLEKSEIPKLEAIKEKGDSTIAALVKIGQIYFQQKAYDEARVMLRHLQQFTADDAEQKKTIQYYITLTYASQKLNEKAVGEYTEFNAAFKGDPMGDNLPLIIGSLFLTNDPKTNDSEKAAQFFKEGAELYPNGHYVNETLTQQANTLIQLKKFDEALATFTNFLKRKPKAELACSAEFGIATVLKETGKLPEAITQYKKVRDGYAGTPQAEQSAFWVGQLSLQKGDLPSIGNAVTELTAFLKNFPKSELFPSAKFSLAQAKAAKKENAEALKLYKEVSDEFPKSVPATFSYFQRANLLSEDQKVEEMVALMKEFIQKYPDDDKVFYAFNSVGQVLINTSKPKEAIQIYSEYAEKHPKDPHAAEALLNLVQLWHQYSVAQGRYLALQQTERDEWNKGIVNSTKAAEQLIGDYPESEQVATALQELMEAQKMLMSAKLKTEADLIKYFQGLAAKFESNPNTKSKVLFSLAAFIYDTNKVKGLEMMKSAYNPSLVYAPEVIDLYGSALLEAGKVEDSSAVYQKLSKDFPIPEGVDPEKAPAPVQAAQAIALYGHGKALQKQGKTKETSEVFAKLKKSYPWSPKMLEADFGIAEGMVQDKKLDEAAALLVQIIRAQTATADLRANSMFLLGGIYEQKGDIASAIDQYIKIAVFYEGVPKTASEGLWKGGQLLEQQAPSMPDKAKKKGEATKTSQMAKAVAAYKDIVSKYPNSAHVAEANEKLKALDPK